LLGWEVGRLLVWVYQIDGWCAAGTPNPNSELIPPHLDFTPQYLHKRTLCSLQQIVYKQMTPQSSKKFYLHKGIARYDCS